MLGSKPIHSTRVANAGIMTKPPINHLRWSIAVLLCLASELNYMDRVALSVLKERMQVSLHFDDTGYARISATFLWVYACSYLMVGWIVDRIGSRRGMLVFVSGWSVANMLHALATGLGSLTCFRALLAFFEPGSFPAGMKAICEWFPLRDRALATGIFIAGTSLGSTLAVPIVEVLAQKWGWQSAFVVTGLMGMAWVLLWYLIYQLPEHHPRLSTTERQLILAGRELENDATPPAPLSQLMRMREFWGCVAARVCTDPISYFLLFWGPSYIRTKGGYVAEHFAQFAWMPFAAMMIGYLFSGAMPRFLMSHNWGLNIARKTTIFGVSIVILLLCGLLTQIRTPEVSLIVFAGICFGHGAWGNMTFPAEVFPKQAVGIVTGFGGFLGAIVGGITQLLIGNAVLHYGYGPIFTVISVMYLIALGIVHFTIGELGVIRNLNKNRTEH